MADDDNKKESGSELATTIFEIVFILIIFIYFLNQVGVFISRHFYSINQNGATSTAATSSGISLLFSSIGHGFSSGFARIFPTIELLAIFISVLFLMGVIYILFRLHYLERFQRAREKRERTIRSGSVEVPKGNIKWQRVLDHVNSENPNDWRLAILEGDILLGDLLEKMGYHGEGIGEMLKSVEKSDFNTIDNAWEAHKIRNAIAHEGADFILSQREARRVIALYESVFQEFHFI
ncbi:MAG TPA: hypothetical protein VFA52_00285 [Candidatus Paceibacterota bacterium]|nr:hypothetical protein [Candidatus Paceibacterota bacterium]